MKAVPIALMVSLWAGPALAQSTACRDDAARERCAAVEDKARRARYDAPPIEDFARQKVEIMRAFFVDGYGRDVGLVTLWRARAAEPRVEWRLPETRDDGQAIAPIAATLALPAWRAVMGASGYFDRTLVQKPSAEVSICLHGWTTRVEMAGTDGTVRRATQSGCGEDALVWPFAWRMTAAAIAAMPACALLDAERTRNDVTRLGKCARLDGDRAAAAEAMNVYDTPWFANPSGEDFAVALTHVFADRLHFAWPGEPVATGAEAAARSWSGHVGQAPFFPRRIFGETADRVRLEGVVLMPGTTTEAPRKPLPATFIWQRCNGFGFRVTHFWTGATPPPPSARTSCSHVP